MRIQRVQMASYKGSMSGLFPLSGLGFAPGCDELWSPQLQRLLSGQMVTFLFSLEGLGLTKCFG